MKDDRELPFMKRAYRFFEDARANLREVETLSREKDLSEIDAYREPLSMDTRKEVTVLLSWGGPSDGYKVYFDDEGEVMAGHYFFADWFEYEEYKLSDDELDLVLTLYFSA